MPLPIRRDDPAFEQGLPSYLLNLRVGPFHRERSATRQHRQVPRASQRHRPSHVSPIPKGPAPATDDVQGELIRTTADLILRDVVRRRPDRRRVSGKHARSAMKFRRDLRTIRQLAQTFFAKGLVAHGQVAHANRIVSHHVYCSRFCLEEGTTQRKGSGIVIPSGVETRTHPLATYGSLSVDQTSGAPPQRQVRPSVFLFHEGTAQRGQSPP